MTYKSSWELLAEEIQAKREASNLHQAAVRGRVIDVLKSEEQAGLARSSAEARSREAYARHLIMEDAIACGEDPIKAAQDGHSRVY